jgi:hypothetical protein
MNQIINKKPEALTDTIACFYGLVVVSLPNLSHLTFF